ncbi:hypothetical protein ABMN38_004188 [Escherichia coli]|jgi:hypothetical protein|uniref:phosphoribosyltransferase-like protein n=1 Tax=Escherichia coli TaxID=562 RepID=UPI000DDB4E4D|nr:hypothetical protein [Escherichia coli]EJQ5988467.1 hypothetical protein [Escherichia coli]EJU0899813.1 hypothetical protein [Escherichia coli]MDZ8264937.1 hypothetical protein [Escherichia coli]HAH1550708.1 hypothetical protein [Escherichia coli]HAM9901263.1 hypothetical protein [Escherichia coli]
MISNTQAVQHWLKQFSKPHRNIAKSLLDSLIYIKTSTVINDLKEEIAQNIGVNVVSILPIRELTPNENVYDLLDKSIPPVVQVSSEPLGSEAFISNLYTQLNRRNNQYFPLPQINIPGRKGAASISLDEMRILNVKKLILVDDLIGSGDRTKEFIERVYNHPTIKSRLSFGTLEIEILAYMATHTGQSVIEKYISNKKGLSLNVLYSAPIIDEIVNHKEITSLCHAYAHNKEKHPLGYKGSAVRVIFSHSAPNNIPSILHRTVIKYKPKTNGITPASRWDALFPRRYIPTDFTHEIEEKIKIQPKLLKIKSILKLLEVESLSLKQLSKISGFPQYELKLILKNLNTAGWVHYRNHEYEITGIGRVEIEIGSKTKGFKIIAINPDFYYPRKR